MPGKKRKKKRKYETDEIFNDKYLQLKCPRCGCKKIWDLGESFDCLNCKVEFNKSTLLVFGLENALSEEEKANILKLLSVFGIEDVYYSTK
ncbi:MAG: hypothetical protein ACFFAS_14890 [Promethearchaeota archaeon]